MMRECDECSQWAQWRGVVKEGDKVILVRHLCQVHKDTDKTPNIKFVFVGAMPNVA
jgi:hypothetical protein